MSAWDGVRTQGSCALRKDLSHVQQLPCLGSTVWGSQDDSGWCTSPPHPQPPGKASLGTEKPLSPKLTMVAQEGNTTALPQPPPKPAQWLQHCMASTLGNRSQMALLRSVSGVHPFTQIFVVTSTLQSGTRRPACGYAAQPSPASVSSH